MHGRTVGDRNKHNQKQNNKGQGQQNRGQGQQNKGQGQQKSRKQETNQSNTDSSASQTGSLCTQKFSGTGVKAKLDQEIPSTSQVHECDQDSESCSNHKNIGSVFQSDKTPSNTDHEQLLHNQNLEDNEIKSGSDTDLLQLEDNVAKDKDNVEYSPKPQGKGSVENSPKPNERIEETEERPDEYLYKMIFVPTFFPYLR